jgi:predicted Zn finger-like uncharacterized protein
LRIRCERCSTVYELDASRLSPGGTPVQCTRCRHVFHAFPTVDGRSPGTGGTERAETTEVFAAADPTSQYPAPAPAPSRVRPPPAAHKPAPRPTLGRVAEPSPGVLRWSRATWFLVGGLVVAVVVTAAWMVLWGGRPG